MQAQGAAAAAAAGSAGIYNKRLQRAKSVNASRASMSGTHGEGGPLTGFSLDLSGLSDDKETVAKGDHSVGEQKIVTTPRATTDVAVSVKGAPKHHSKQLFRVGPSILGDRVLVDRWLPLRALGLMSS